VGILFFCGTLAASGAFAATPAAKPAAAKPAGSKPGAKPAAGKQVSGKQLVAESKKAIAGILKTAKASGGKLDPKNKKQAPFFGGLKELRASLAETEKYMQAKDKKAFASLSKGSSALAQVKTAWPRLGVEDAKVEGYLSKLDNSYSALRGRYGAEGPRAKEGKELSAKEKANFAKIKAQQAEYGKKLAPMQAKAKQKGDKGMEAQLVRLSQQADRIAKAPDAVDAYLAAMLLLDYLQGEWEAYSYYVGPDYRADWVTVNVWVETSFVSCDTLYLETVEVYSVESWEVTIEVDSDFDYAVTDIADADLSAGDSYLESNFSYDELSSEIYAEEFATDEMQDLVFEEEDVNLDVAEEAWEDEGLELDSADDMLDAEDADDAAEDEDAAGDDVADDADDDAGDDADDDGADDADDDGGDDAADDGADDADDDGGDDADDDGGDDADDDGADDAADDGADDADDDGGDDAGDEGDDEELA